MGLIELWERRNTPSTIRSRRCSSACMPMVGRRLLAGGSPRSAALCAVRHQQRDRHRTARDTVPAVGRVTILDGGTGRELARIGAPFSQPLWSAQALIESPEHVRRVHESFVTAGAEVITTNAYALVPFHLGRQLFDTDGRRLARLAGSIARDV